MWNDTSWRTAAEDDEVQNNIGWCTTTKGAEVWNDTGSHAEGIISADPGTPLLKNNRERLPVTKALGQTKGFCFVKMVLTGKRTQLQVHFSGILCKNLS